MMSQSQQLARPAPLDRGELVRVGCARVSRPRTEPTAGLPNLSGASARVPRAFSLVELLIVIAIISVLAAMSVSMLAGASNDAKKSATQARLSQITAMLQLQMEDYEVRRLPIPNRILAEYVAANPIMDGSGPMNARLQLKYLRRQLLMALIDSEMPRPARVFAVGQPITYIENKDAGLVGSEINLAALSIEAQKNTTKNVNDFGTPVATFYEWIVSNYGNAPAGRPALLVASNNLRSGGAEKWRRQVDNLTAQGLRNELDLPGEYLHEILRSIQIDGQSAVEMLGNSAIANDDNDAFPEVVDAWGDPLIFDLEQFGATIDTTDNSVRSNSNGVVPLDPRYPMALGDLQIVVGSSRIPESLPVIERISRGVE